MTSTKSDIVKTTKKESGSGSHKCSILFVCGRNSVRSPMAEVLARNLLPAGSFIASAGIRSGERDPFVDVVLAEIGLYINEWQCHLLEDVEDSYFDMIVTLCPEAHHLALELNRSHAVEVEYWPTMDPSVVEGTREQTLDAYRELRDYLAKKILARFTL